MSVPSTWTWDAMLDAFRGLGGVADNIRLGDGPRGRGLFVIDPAKPVFLQLPPNLLFPVKDIEFADRRIKIRDSAAIAQPERNFFEEYENAFSWGAGGTSEDADFVAELRELPPAVRALLTAGFGMRDLIEGDVSVISQERFLERNALAWENQNVVMPLVDLANRDANGLPYRAGTQGQLQIQGRVGEELLVQYGPEDPFGVFVRFGLATPQRQAYSLPMAAKGQGRRITIERSIWEQAIRGDFRVPRVRFEGPNPVLSYLAIGSPRLPRMSRAIFQTLMRDAGIENADEIFDNILYYNRMKFLELTAALEPHVGEMALTLRRMARYQLEAMSHCVGTRTL